MHIFEIGNFDNTHFIEDDQLACLKGMEPSVRIGLQVSVQLYLANWTMSDKNMLVWWWLHGSSSKINRAQHLLHWWWIKLGQIRRKIILHTYVITDLEIPFMTKCTIWWICISNKKDGFKWKRKKSLRFVVTDFPLHLKPPQNPRVKYFAPT